MQSRIKLVVFDWASTVIDLTRCLAAEAEAFRKLFAAHGVEATLDQARAPMGLEKRDHIRAMLGDARLAGAWKAVRGRGWTEDDVSMLYRDFAPIQMAAAKLQLLPHSRRARGAGLSANQGHQIGRPNRLF